MKHRYLTILTAALLLTGCGGGQQANNAEQSQEQTGAGIAAPITLQTVTQAEINMPDLSEFGIDTSEFSPANEPYIQVYDYGEVAYSGENPKKTYFAYYNPENDKLLFDLYGRLVSYTANEQTAWSMNPDPNAYTTYEEDDESLKSSGPDGETGALAEPVPGSDPDNDSGSTSDDSTIQSEDGRITHFRDAYGVDMLSEEQFREIADHLLDTILPERDAFTERTEDILKATDSQIFLPCDIFIKRPYNEDISDSAYVSLDYDGRVQSFEISYANISDLSVSDTLRAKAEAYAKEMYSSNPTIEEMNGRCMNLDGTVYGWYSVTFLFNDGYGCDEILVRAD